MTRKVTLLATVMVILEVICGMILAVTLRVNPRVTAEANCGVIL